MIKYEIQRTSQFKKDFKLAVKRGCSVEKLQKVVTILASGDIAAALMKQLYTWRT